MAADAQRFFDEYARAASGEDPEDMASFYDENVLHAGPKGTLGFRNDARYRSWLSDILEFNQDCGLAALLPTGVGSYDLGPSLVIATVQWRALFDGSEHPADFTVTYLLRRAPDGLRILCAASHEDQEAQLRALGVTPQARPAARRAKRRSRSTPTKQPAARQPSAKPPSTQ
jgi:hypothetical protein